MTVHGEAAVLVLAAGAGTRMKSDTNKVLHTLAGRSMLSHALHAAAKVGIVGSWEDFRSINVDGTANVIAAARELGLSRVVYVSTPSVSHAGHSLVGALADPPVTGRVDAHYAESKAMAERLQA